MLKIHVEPRNDIPDARTVPSGKQDVKIEFNPTRPRGRVRFSVAHEIAHTLFPDCAESIRNRGGSINVSPDDWQLEVLCNIGAAEITMPTGSFPELKDSQLDIDEILALRRISMFRLKQFLIRTVKLAKLPCAVFCGSRVVEDSPQFHLDYVIASQSWSPLISPGIALPQGSIVEEANAIGFTAKGIEIWRARERLAIQCVGLPPYPGSLYPRVAGIVTPVEGERIESPQITYLNGDALAPRGDGVRIVAHVIPDSSTVWGGGGFAATMRKRFPKVWSAFRDETTKSRERFKLGNTFRGWLDEEVGVMHMVAQHGVGPSEIPRIRYSSLERCLQDLKCWAGS